VATPPRGLRDLLLTRDPKQQIVLAHAGLGASLMIVAVLVMHAMTWLGVNDGAGLWPWTVLAAVGLVTMFLAIRLGWSARFDDPSLTMPQLLYARRRNGVHAASCRPCAVRGQGGRSESGAERDRSAASERARACTRRRDPGEQLATAAGHRGRRHHSSSASRCTLSR
jgi:hypothetical protein